MTDMEIRTPSTLTEDERTETKRLIDAFNLIPDEVGKKIALAFIEGVATASDLRPERTA